MEILQYSATQLGEKIRRREADPVKVVEKCFSQMKEWEPVCHSFITIEEEKAYERAEKIRKDLERGVSYGPLAGVPVAVKDNICTKGIPTTCGSRMLASFVPSYSAEVIRKLEEGGAILLGKTNMDEFAMGNTTETSFFGPTKNPWNPSYVPGGSSGGSGTAVAAGEAFYALGSDTGGSIRQPASFCGLVGLKPTYGTVSRYGLVAYASSLDQVGPITRTVEDCAAVLEQISGRDPKDATSLPRQDLDFLSALKEDVTGMRIGIPKEYFTDRISPQVEKAVKEAAQVLARKGAVVEEFSLSFVEAAVPAYYTIACAEAGSNLARFDGVKYGYRSKEYEGLHDMYKKSRAEGFGWECKRRILLGSFVLSEGYYDAYYLQALRVKRLIKQAFDQAFKRFDLILGPVFPTTAPKLGDSLPDPMKMYLGDIYTVCANLTGIPAITLPCGLDSNGLPIGLQLMADCLEEKKLLQAAYTYEQSRTVPLCPAIRGEREDQDHEKRV